MSGSWTEAQQAFLQQAAQGEAEAVRRMQQFGDDYLGITRELWKYVESRGNPAPGAAPPASDAGLERLRDSLQQKFARLFAPSFDPLRAQQLATGRLTDATLRWQRATTRISELLSAVATDAVLRLAAELADPAASGPLVTSLRQLHDLWVECGEQAYRAAAQGDAFATAQAELLMAMVELRFEQRSVIEEWARAFQLPTRAEIDAIHRRLHELNRRLRELQKP